MKAMLPSAAVLLLAGCTQFSPSVSWQDYYDKSLAAGLQRTERVPDDAPVDRTVLAESFRKLAFNFEPDPFEIGENQTGEDMLRRWMQPVLYTISADPGGTGALDLEMQSFAARLSRATAHPIQAAENTGEDGTTANLFVLVNSDSSFRTVANLRRDLEALDLDGPSDAEADPELVFAWFLSGVVERWIDAPSPCSGSVLVGDGTNGTKRGEIFFGLVLIRQELPAPMITSCIEEEVAQAMGLFNDDFDVRPTIFNDDEEYALLTRHDELLLRILYDPRLAPGMIPDDAMPVVRQIARELTNGT